MMTRKQPSTGKIKDNSFETLELSGLPSDISSVQVEFLKQLIHSFNETAARLKEAYVTLQNKFDALNLQLEETNRELTKSLDEQERLSNYLTNILESLSSGVLVVDNEGRITLFNRGASLMTGIDEQWAVGRHYQEVIGTDMPEELTPLHVLSTREAQTQMEKTLISKSGDTIPVGFSVSPLVNASGELLGAVEIFMDLTRIKNLEDELSRMDKLAALGQMSATMAHKIRNPLGGIVGYAGLLDTRLGSDEKAKLHIRKIIEGVEKINHIITSVLSYNSQLKLNPREISLEAKIMEMLSMMKQDREELDSSRVGFTLSHPAEPAMVEVDIDMLNAAMLNIIGNAVEAVEGEGTVDIRIIPGRSLESPECVMTSQLLKTMKHSSKLLKSKRPASIITVTDSGTGMEQEVMENLFVPFFTTKEKRIGLGLASARKIIELHHGEIWVESIPGRGTAVGVIIPSKSTVV